MTAVFTSRLPSAATGYWEYLKKVGTTDTAVSVTVPSNVTCRTLRPWWAAYKRRIYAAAMFSRPLVFCEDYKLYSVGIAAPTVAPTLAAGAGTGLTGSYIGYYTFAHKIGDTLVHESSLSPGTSTVVLANQNRSWTGFPTSAPDPRVNYIRLYVSVAGGTPKFVMEKAIGDSDTITEAIADAFLLEEGSSARGVPPYSLYIEAYHGRMFYVDPAHPDRLYFSELNEMESVDDLSWIPTQGGETITGIRVVRGQLVVFCRNVTYIVQGFDDNDLTMDRISPAIGCIAPYSIVNINEVLYFMSERGVFTYDGSAFRYTMRDLFDFFIGDFGTWKNEYPDAIGCENRRNGSYHLLIPKSTGYRYVGDYGLSSVDALTEPNWSFFRRNRFDYVVGLVRGEMATGSDDGYVRFEDVVADTDDDGDTYQKKYVIQTRCEFNDSVGWEELAGKRWVEISLFLKAELSAWTIKAYAGSEQTAFAVGGSDQPQYETTVQGSQLTGFLAKSHHLFRPEALSGKGVMLRIEATGAANNDFLFMGYELAHTGGANMRSRL